MDTSREQHYYQLLTDLQARLQPQIAAMLETVQSGAGQSGTEVSSAPSHLGDQGTDEFLRDVTATVMENEEQMAAEVREALHRLDEGRYGTCEECGTAIPADRLDAIPYTRFCVSCSRMADKGSIANLNRGRPSNADLLATTGEMGERRRDRQRQEQSEANEHTTPEPDDADRHAAGTAGGGTSVGGLAGTTIGHGDPDASVIEDATGSGQFDSREDRQPLSPEKIA